MVSAVCVLSCHGGRNTQEKGTQVLGKTIENLHQVLNIAEAMEKRAEQDDDMALSDFVVDVQEALLNVLSILHGNGEVL